MSSPNKEYFEDESNMAEYGAKISEGHRRRKIKFDKEKYCFKDGASCMYYEACLEERLTSLAPSRRFTDSGGKCFEDKPPFDESKVRYRFDDGR